MGKLLAPLSAAPGEPAAVPVSTLGLIVDLLCFCAQNHQFRIKYYSLRNNVGEKVGGRAAGQRADGDGDVAGTVLSGTAVLSTVLSGASGTSWCIGHSTRAPFPEQVLRLVRRRERWLVCAAIRFVRTCIGMKDDFFNRYLTRNNLFEPVLAAFFENGERYNLLNSAVLEMVDFIR